MLFIIYPTAKLFRPWVNIKHGEGFFCCVAEFIKNDRNEQVVCSLKKGQKKVLSGGKLDSQGHVGFIPC
jgi:DNA replication and repair protein RecF